ncbi:MULTISPECIES: RidA family protein [Mycolicibacterium]|uniref:RidA family protein n=1 Tax=Mycolicibacterium TaxID=1866885 RepID=UPI001E43F58B|nr:MULTISPECIES: RidA family protein [Mycolicibacterium]UGU29930.1 RidA family protein [Mycolicibacterium smegmatis]ULN48274.1 RidA family protein [Mycolicibacterium goodii]ULN70868.1 RidA family protein [Mycolicibacterium smegmatis]
MNETSTIPVPQGDYRPATRLGTVIYTAGMTPRRDGELIDVGVVGANVDLDRARVAARQAAANAVVAAESCLFTGEAIAQVLRMSVFIASAPTFAEHSLVADAASEILRKRYGERGLGARTAVGVACLPGGAPVEVELTAGVRVADGRLPT